MRQSDFAPKELTEIVSRIGDTVSALNKVTRLLLVMVDEPINNVEAKRQPFL